MTDGVGDDELVFVPLGGVGEIGMNAALYGFGPKRRRKWIMVDCGVAFAGDDLPGIDLVMPDIALHRGEPQATCSASSSRTRTRTISAR